MKKLYTLLVLTTITIAAKAQYTLTTLSGQTYTEITSATFEIPDTSQYWGNINTKPDMTFKSFGKSYNLADDVFIPILEGYAYFFNPTRSTTVYGAKGDFRARPGSNQTSMFSFKTETVADEKAFIMQWKNMGFSAGDSNDFINFQIWLYENSGIIEMHYGPQSIKNNIWIGGANGPVTGLLEMDPGFTILYNRIWLTGSGTNPEDSTGGLFLELSSPPTAGTVYRFTPIISSVPEAANGKFVIYPTLVNGGAAVNIKAPANNQYTATVYTTTGQKVCEQAVIDGTVSLSNLPAGVYLLTLETNSAIVYTQRVVKVD